MIFSIILETFEVLTDDGDHNPNLFQMIDSVFPTTAVVEQNRGWNLLCLGCPTPERHIGHVEQFRDICKTKNRLDFVFARHRVNDLHWGGSFVKKLQSA